MDPWERRILVIAEIGALLYKWLVGIVAVSFGVMFGVTACDRGHLIEDDLTSLIIVIGLGGGVFLFRGLQRWIRQVRKEMT